jgi:predicted phage terminase large subunit-like protein
LAWVDGKWLNRTERAEVIKTYGDYIAMLDEKYPQLDDMTAEVIADYSEKSAELDRFSRIHRCEGNLLEFSIEYFSEARNPENDGNWEGFDVTGVEDAPDFHVELTDIMNTVSNEYINDKVATAAPRSHAKSTYLSKAFPIHEVVYRKRKYTIIISETPKVSKANMEWIRNQLKYNRKLREDFGPLLSPKDQANIQDNGEGFIAWHPDGESRKQIALVEAASTGQALRGRNWNGARPDLIICDDLEDARPGGNAATPEQRQALRDWFSQTVIPLGDPKGLRTAFVYMGTTVHFEALLMHVLYDRSDFKTKVYRAIIDHPERDDLWEQCREIYIDRENPNRKDDAISFYEQNKDEMLRGSKVLWPDVQPLLKLKMWKWDNGSKAFNTEYMNNPIDEESMVFNPETFTYWSDNVDDYDFHSKEYTLSMGLDFAFGKERGDYSALHVVARHKELDVLYVIDSFIKKLPIDDFFEIIINKVKEWQPDIVAADSNVAQEFIADQLTKRLDAEGYPASTRLKKIKNRTKKELRIEAMKPDIENGTIRFHRKHSVLLEQFERYGQGAADDGPDSLNMAVTTVVAGKKRKAVNTGTYRY